MQNQDLNQEQHNKICAKCKENFVYMPDEVFWDDHGFGYSTKLTKCPYCGSVNIIKYYEDASLDINNDSRFYEYA